MPKDNFSFTENSDGTATVFEEDHLEEVGSTRSEDDPNNSQNNTSDDADSSSTADTLDDDDLDDDDSSMANRQEEGPASTEGGLSKTEQNRLARHRKKLLRTEKFEQLQAQLASTNQTNQQLQEQLNILSRRTTGAEIVQVEQELSRIEQTYLYHKGVMEAASQAGKVSDALQAGEKMNSAKARYGEVTRLKEAISRQTTVGTVAMPDPAVTTNATKWATGNKWYNPSGQDFDSRITREIDSDLTKEGFDPRTTSYWEELDRRVQKHLPHRASVDNNNRNRGSTSRPRNTVAGSGREDIGTGGSGSGGGGNKFTLSVERVQAMKDAGQWADPKKRSEMTKYYRDYDRASSGKA